MSLQDSFENAVREALEPHINSMIKEAEEKNLSPANAVIIISNDAALIFGYNIRVLFGAAEIGTLRNYPLIAVSYFKDTEVRLLSRDVFIKSLEAMAGKNDLS